MFPLDFKQVWNFLTNFRKYPESNFTHIRPVGATLMYMDERTDRRTDGRTDEQPDINSAEENVFMTTYSWQQRHVFRPSCKLLD
jgi:hypothetical protein